MNHRIALIVIDVQCALFASSPAPFEALLVIERVNALALAARAAGAPVIFVQHERDGSPLEFGSAGWQLAPGLQRLPNDVVVRKTTPDSFLRTELQTLLQQSGIERVVVCGYASEFCVDTTVRRAAALGFSVLLAADAHTTHDKTHASAAAIRAHENATLPHITSFGPMIHAMPTAEIGFCG